MSFNSIAGNTRVKRILKMALQKGRVPNSLLFCGPEGVGKLRMAKELAIALNCLQAGDEACGDCVPCGAIRAGFDDEGKAGAFPDVMVIQPEKAVIKIDQMKFVKQMAYLKPLSGKRRVFIVDQAETMNEEAANSLLKVLEEPPHFTHIVLVTSNPFRILPTIRSRCQILSFSPITREEIERILLENGYPSERARVLAPFVDGNLERALNLDWEEIGLAREEAWNLFLSVASPKGGSEFLSRYIQMQRAAVQEDLGKTLEIFASFCRDILLIQEGGDERFLRNPDYAEALKETSCRWDVGTSLACLDLTESALAASKRNMNVNLLAATYFLNFGEKHV